MFIILDKHDSERVIGVYGHMKYVKLETDMWGRPNGRGDYWKLHDGIRAWLEERKIEPVYYFDTYDKCWYIDIPTKYAVLYKLTWGGNV